MSTLISSIVPSSSEKDDVNVIYYFNSNNTGQESTSKTSIKTASINFNVSQPFMTYEYQYGNTYIAANSADKTVIIQPGQKSTYLKSGAGTFKYSVKDTYIRTSDSYRYVDTMGLVPSDYTPVVNIEFPYTQLTSVVFSSSSSSTSSSTSTSTSSTNMYTLFGLSYNSTSTFDLKWLKTSENKSIPEAFPNLSLDVTTIVDTISKYYSIDSDRWLYITTKCKDAYQLTPLPLAPTTNNVTFPIWLNSEPSDDLNIINFVSDSLRQKITPNRNITTEVLTPITTWMSEVIASGSDADRGLLLWVLGTSGKGNVTAANIKAWANTSLLQVPTASATTSSTGTSTSNSTGISGSVTDQFTIVVTNNISTAPTWLNGNRHLYDTTSGASLDVFYSCYPPGLLNTQGINPLRGTYPYLNTTFIADNYGPYNNVYNDMYDYYDINGAPSILSTHNGVGYGAFNSDSTYAYNATSVDSKGETINTFLKVSIAELGLTKPIFYPAWTQASQGYLLDYQQNSDLSVTQGYTVTYNPLYPGYCVFLLTNGGNDLTPLKSNIQYSLSSLDADAIQNVGLTLTTKNGTFNIPANYITAYYQYNYETNDDYVGGNNFLRGFNRRGFVDTSLYFGKLAPICVRMSLSQITMAGSKIGPNFETAYETLMLKLYLTGLLVVWSKRITATNGGAYTLSSNITQISNKYGTPNWYLCTLQNPFKSIVYNNKIFSGTISGTTDPQSIMAILNPPPNLLNTLNETTLVIALCEQELFSVFQTQNEGIIGKVMALPQPLSGDYILTKDSTLTDANILYVKNWPQNVPHLAQPAPIVSLASRYKTTILIVVGIIIFLVVISVLVILILRIRTMSPLQRYLANNPLPQENYSISSQQGGSSSTSF
jgi:hypothetical protein